MKNLLILTLLAVSTSGFAQIYLKEDTRIVLNKTAELIEKNQELLFYNEEYRGYFALGLKHQKLGVIYYHLNDYRNAICHSYRSRTALFNSFHEKNRRLPDNWKRTPREVELTEKCPGYAEMDTLLFQYSPQLELDDEPYISAPLKDIRVEEL